MKPLLINLILLAVYFRCVELTVYCTTPDGLQGHCTHLDYCKRLQAINNSPVTQVTLYDYMVLIQSKCKARIRNLFCCPYPRNTAAPMTQMGCYMPGGQYGSCSRINLCPALRMKLNEPVNVNNVNFINSLRCNSPDEYRVCCPQTPFWDIDPRAPETQHGKEFIEPKQKCFPTALPPDPESDCCGQQVSDDDRIIGGLATAIDQYPWLVLIEYEEISTKSLDLLCGGSLISGRYVLTASHCVAGRVLTKFTPVNVRLGEYDISNPGPDCKDAPGGGEDCTDEPRTIAIEEIIRHDSYNAVDVSRNHDIALIRLSEVAPYTYFIRPICLPKTDLTLNPSAELKLQASGWGFIENTHGIRSNVKLHVDLPYMSRSACQQLFSKINVTISERQLCAGGEEGKDACKGDSGGPLMHSNSYRYEVTGVVSFGPKPCGQQNVPSVYTNVYQYLPWISSNMRS